MKKIILCFISFAFIANSLVVSANVMFCAQNSTDPLVIELSSDADMPCHDNQNNAPQKQCDDACYCPVYTNNLTSIIDETSIISYLSNEDTSNLDSLLVSRSPPPIFRPPIS